MHCIVLSAPSLCVKYLKCNYATCLLGAALSHFVLFISHQSPLKKALLPQFQGQRLLLNPSVSSTSSPDQHVTEKSLGFSFHLYQLWFSLLVKHSKSNSSPEAGLIWHRDLENNSIVAGKVAGRSLRWLVTLYLHTGRRFASRSLR